MQNLGGFQAITTLLLRYSEWLLVSYYVLGLLLAQIKEAHSKSLWYEISIMTKCIGWVTGQNLIHMLRCFSHMTNYKNKQWIVIVIIVLANTSSNQFWQKDAHTQKQNDDWIIKHIFKICTHFQELIKEAEAIRFNQAIVSVEIFEFAVFTEFGSFLGTHTFLLIAFDTSSPQLLGLFPVQPPPKPAVERGYK